MKGRLLNPIAPVVRVAAVAVAALLPLSVDCRRERRGSTCGLAWTSSNRKESSVKARLTVLVVAVAAIAAAATTPAAHAAGEIGPSAPAHVYCDSFPDQISISPTFGSAT